MTYIGRISLLPAEYDFHWQNMIYTGLFSLLLAEYAANQKCSAVLLCSADSIYPPPHYKDLCGGSYADGRYHSTVAIRYTVEVGLAVWVLGLVLGLEGRDVA